MQTIILAGIDLTDSIEGDFREPELIIPPLRQGSAEGSHAPTLTRPTFVLIHNNDRDQHEIETYRIYLAWAIYRFEDRLIPLEQLHEISNLVSLYNSGKISVPPEYVVYTSKPGLQYGIYSVNSDISTPPQYY